MNRNLLTYILGDWESKIQELASDRDYYGIMPWWKENREWKKQGG
jgi:hypothetical protein